MSMIWRSTMPLLSTLAALVIIVHSAEDELDPGYRRDLRPRAVDPGTNSYEQPWKAIDADPLVQQSTHADVWDDSLEEPKVRRRPIRKRRRRPQTSEETEPYGRYRESQQAPYFDVDYDSYQTTELPRRRRKRPDVRPNRYTDEQADTETRPIRKLGLRKKRPTITSSPRLSELNGWGSMELNQEGKYRTEPNNYESEEDSHKHYSEPELNNRAQTKPDYNTNFDNSEEINRNEKLNLRDAMSSEIHVDTENSPKKYPTDPYIGQDAIEDHGRSEELHFTTGQQTVPSATAPAESTKVVLPTTEYEKPKTFSEFSMEDAIDKNLEVKATSKSNFEPLDNNENYTQYTPPQVMRVKQKDTKLLTKVIEKMSNMVSKHNWKLKKQIRQLKCQDKLHIKNIAKETYNQILDKYKAQSLHTNSLVDEIQAKYYNQVQERQDDSHNPEIKEEAYKMNPLDPISLKQILKRSNGTSLSEILQRHNLSLTDLLQGKGEAIFAVDKYASQEQEENRFDEDSQESTHQLKQAESKYTQTNVIPIKLQTTPRTSINNNAVAFEVTTSQADTNSSEKVENIDSNEPETRVSEVVKVEQIRERPNMNVKRRFPDGIRRKLRMRPMLNTTLKAQLSRELIELNAKKYAQNNKTNSKAREWKDIIPIMTNRTDSNEYNIDNITEFTPITTEPVAEITITDWENQNTSQPSILSSNINDNEVENNIISTTEATTGIIIEVFPSEIANYTDKPKVIPIVRPAVNNSALRRQAFNNRLKRKRLKQKTTVSPQIDSSKSFYGMPNLVSASEFIERTQKPYTTVTQDNAETVTELEDFMTTHAPTTVDVRDKPTRLRTSRLKSTSTTKAPESSSTTEQSAKFEIEEILNDTMTSERLGKILSERNMTLGELVKHRERGSSHVHLADIFHNASKEPNPPEPFLTKSSIEPISKETYPLRAILEANTHDSASKPTNVQTATVQESYKHIPVVMDFGNNVNENGENMGIMSLFDKLIENNINASAAIQQDSEGSPYVSSVLSVNTTNNDTNRESRMLSNHEDAEGWSKLLSIMANHDLNDKGKELRQTSKDTPVDKHKESFDDEDGDGLMISEDLQHLKDFESNIASRSDEKLDVKMFERNEVMAEKPGILNKFRNNARSVAIATASILGLSTILFLLTYIALKYKHQRTAARKKDSFCDERIPSPVFEHRKGHKNNGSSRSISPMISNSNIYTMSTLDSHHGKDSPDYMWNSLRKPFQ